MYERYEQIEKIKRALQNANSLLEQGNLAINQNSPFHTAHSNLESAISFETGVESKFTKYQMLD
jgi:hypothetical protein